jgi:uncharacterized protein (TIGR02145 family)
MKIKSIILLLVLSGLILSFTYSCKKDSKKVIPTITTGMVSNITSTTATCAGEISSDGGAAVTSRGVCWSLNEYPTIADNKTSDGTGSGSFSSSITGLVHSSTYYIRAYATNSVGTVYGTQSTFTTLAVLPTLTTALASDITATTAISGGNITNDGGTEITARGICWSTILSIPTISLDAKTIDDKGMGTFKSNITGLSPMTAYNIRAYATNSIGTAYGDLQTFTTDAALPTINTNGAANIASNSLSCGGAILDDGGATITARGVCWSTQSNPTIDLPTKTSDENSPGSFVSTVNGLNSNTTYYIRAYATNRVGTAYGSAITVATKPQVTDIDGNVYHTVSIGSQVWLIENLKTKRYRNGDPILNVTGGLSWTKLNIGAYCDYDNDGNNSTVYGCLYNWYALTDSRNITPVGWHVPNVNEWITLENYLGGTAVTGGKLKERGTAHWDSPNTGATNASGFTALPAGFCGGHNGGMYVDLHTNASFWSTVENGASNAWGYILSSDTNDFSATSCNKPTGLSIRCVMN